MKVATRRAFTLGALALGLALWSAAQASAQAILSAKPVLRGQGQWRPEASSSRRSMGSPAWSVSLQRGADGTVSGDIQVEGPPLLRSGRVHGRFFGNRVSGVILDESREVAATFRGRVDRATARFAGTYVDRTGESGNWEWNGALTGP